MVLRLNSRYLSPRPATKAAEALVITSESQSQFPRCNADHGWYYGTGDIRNTSSAAAADPYERLTFVTQEAISILLSYKHKNGEIDGLMWWQLANAYTAITLHDTWSTRSTNTDTVHDRLHSILSRHQHCINEFNDDTLWYCHLFLHLYAATSDATYLEHCHAIYHHVSRYVLPHGSRDAKDHPTAGAVLWKSSAACKEVNSITTSLWAEFCAQLALLPPADAAGASSTVVPLPDPRTLLDHALLSLNFLFASLYRAEEAVVLDTLRLDTGEVVDWTFTYTTGQTIAACVSAHAASRQMTNATPQQRDMADEALREAVRMAWWAMRRSQWVRPPCQWGEGVLVEYDAYGPFRHLAEENGDAVGFKSVLVRSLGKLYSYVTTLVTGPVESEGLAFEDMRNVAMDVKIFITWTFASLRNVATDGKGAYGPWWAGPMDMCTAHSQMAVLDVMAVMRLVEREVSGPVSRGGVGKRQ